MPTPNARFTDLGGGVIGEMISPHTQLYYNPATGQASAVFNSARYIQAGASLIPVTTNENIQPLTVNLGTRIMDCPCIAGDLDPITGADLTTISIAGVMTLLKRFYDTEYNAEADRIAAGIAAMVAASQPPEEPPVDP